MANMFEALLADDDIRDPAAIAAALRRQQKLGTLGQLMGVQPTREVGAQMQEGAQTSLRSAMAKQQAAKEAAARAEERKQAQANWQAQMEREQARDAEQRRQFAIQEARLGRTQDQEGKKQWAVDPLTGRLYNQITGEWKDDMPMQAGGAQALPQFNPQLGMKPTEKMKNDLVAIQQQRGSVQGALTAAQGNPKAFGFGEGALERFGGDVGTAFAQWKRNPQDTATRAYVLNNVSAIINERAGAAQSVQELARLRGFLPSETDDVAHVEAKFNAFLDYLDEREAATRGYSPDQLGFTPRTGAGPRKPEYRTPGTPQAQGVSPQGSGRNFEAEYGLGGQ